MKMQKGGVVKMLTVLIRGMAVNLILRAATQPPPLTRLRFDPPSQLCCEGGYPVWGVTVLSLILSIKQANFYLKKLR